MQTKPLQKVYDPKPFEESDNTYQAYVAATSRNNKAGSTFILVRNNKLIKLGNRHIKESGMCAHRAEIIAVIGAVLSAPKDALLDIYVNNVYCVDALVFRNVQSSYQDLVQCFDDSLGHLADLRIHVGHTDTSKLLYAAKDLSDFSSLGIVKQKLPKYAKLDTETNH